MDKMEQERFQRLMAQDPQDPRIAYELGLCYYKGKGVARDYAQAVAWFSRAAGQGDARAQVNLGHCYLYGEGVEEDPVRAVAWFSRAAGQGDAVAQEHLGHLYERGHVFDRDYVLAAAWHRKAAEQGDATAQVSLGICYRHGVGVKRDPDESYKWFRMAADQGNKMGLLDWTRDERYYADMMDPLIRAANQGKADAQYELGDCLQSGGRVERDMPVAAAYFRDAAEQGHAKAQYRLGLCYSWGAGVEKDYVQAAAWFRRAAVQGNAEAQVSLGMCYRQGKGVKTDRDEADKWLRMAAAQGNETQATDQSRDERFYAELLAPLQEAADQGDADAQYELATYYQCGLGVETDLPRAATLFRKAAGQGHGKAQCSLGLCFRWGGGVEQDLAQATQWLRKAADQGDATARYVLEQYEKDRGSASFEEQLEEYARLLVTHGVALRHRQVLNLRADVDCAPLARLCAKYAYKAGAKDVVNDWRDDTMTREHYLHADDEVFDSVYPWEKPKWDSLAKLEAPCLTIISPDPEAMKGVDSRRVDRARRAAYPAAKRYSDAQTANAIQWSIGACATPAWAKKVFPSLPEDQAVEKLWDAIFAAVRVKGDRFSIRYWSWQAARQKRVVKILNSYQFISLHYQNSLGTDLTVGLPEGHRWTGKIGRDVALPCVEFIANMPTEEVFTLPHRDRAEGRVYASMPLALNGNLVKDFWLEFKGGKIVGLHAEVGEEYLWNAIRIDEGARYLGKVALVPYHSPIRDSGILFYEPLFDENAACHLACGHACPCLTGAEGKSKEELLALGVNDSVAHTAIMVGTADLSITGVTKDGREIPVFVDGDFAF